MEKLSSIKLVPLVPKRLGTTALKTILVKTLTTGQEIFIITLATFSRTLTYDLSFMPPSRPVAELGSGHALCCIFHVHPLLLGLPLVLNFLVNFLSHFALLQEALKLALNLMKSQTIRSPFRIPKGANISFFREAHTPFFIYLNFFLREVLGSQQN